MVWLEFFFFFFYLRLWSPLNAHEVSPLLLWLIKQQWRKTIDLIHKEFFSKAATSHLDGDPVWDL